MALAQRGLSEAVEAGAAGILAEGMTLPAGIPQWLASAARRGYRIVLPLYSVLDGQVVGIALRNLRQDADPKVLHSVKRGVLHADARGLELLRGVYRGRRVAIVTEGATDLLALSFTATVPALALPGVGNEGCAVGPWAAGTAVVVATDRDEAGRRCGLNLARSIVAGGGHPVCLPWPNGAKDAVELLTVVGAAAMTDLLERAVLEVMQ